MKHQPKKTAKHLGELGPNPSAIDIINQFSNQERRALLAYIIGCMRKNELFLDVLNDAVAFITKYKKQPTGKVA